MSRTCVALNRFVTVTGTSAQTLCEETELKVHSHTL